MRDDDYVRSWFATDSFNVPDGLAGKYNRPTVVRRYEPTFRGGVSLQSVWDGYDAARALPEERRPPTRLRYVMDVLRATYPELAQASRLIAEDPKSGVCHTSIMRLAKKGSVPYKRSAQMAKMLKYINSSLEIAGYMPVAINELFPRYDHHWGCSPGRYRKFVEDIAKWS